MSGVTVTLTGEDAGLWSAIEKLISQQKRMEGGLSQIVQKSDEAAKKSKALEQAASRVYEATRTPQERHNAQLEKLNKLLDAGRINQETYGRAVKQSTAHMQQAETAGVSAFGPKMLGMVGTLAGAFGLGTGLAGVLQLVNKELEAADQRAQRAKDASMSMADAQIAALRNLGATTTGERDQFIGDVNQMSKETGVSAKDLYLRAGDAISAKGDLSQADAMAAVRVSAQMAPESAQVGQQIAGGILDLKKFMPEWSPEQLAGFFTEANKAARVNDTGKTMQGLAPAMSSAMNWGSSPQAAAALWSAITTTTADQQGRHSKTATIQASQQLAEFLPEKDFYKYEEKPVFSFDSEGKKVFERDADGQIRKQRVRVLDRAGTGLKTLDQRIDYLRANPLAREEFLGGMHAEAAAIAPLRQILTGEGAAARAYDQFYATLPGQQASGQMYDKFLPVLRGGDLQKTASFGRATGSAVERMQVGNTAEARIGILRDQFASRMIDSGDSWVTSSLKDLQVKLSDDKMATTLEKFEDRKKFLDAPTGPGNRFGGFGNKIIEDRAPTPAEKSAAEAFGVMIEEIKGMRADLQKENQKPADPKKATLGQPGRDQ